jgi:hypothetical protein
MSTMPHTTHQRRILSCSYTGKEAPNKSCTESGPGQQGGGLEYRASATAAAGAEKGFREDWASWSVALYGACLYGYFTLFFGRATIPDSPDQLLLEAVADLQATE